MYQFQSVIREIEERINTDDLGAGLKMLLDLLAGIEGQIGAQDVDVVRVQLSQFNRLQREKNRGDISGEEVERRLSGLTVRVLSHIAFLEPRLQKLTLPREIGADAPRGDIVQPGRESVEELVGGYLMSLSWIEHGLRLAKAVCKIQGAFNVGTGFVAGADIIVTNNHVLPSRDAARQARAIFNFEDDLNGNTRATTSYEFDAETLVTLPELDCTMVRVKRNGSSLPLSHWGSIPLQADDAVRRNDPVTIIQHPLGAPKKIGILGNVVVRIETPYIYYTTDTMRGSSGSPVLNTNWAAIALHRAAGQWSRKQDRYLNNQGVLVSEIVRSGAFGSFFQDIDE